MRAGGTPNCLQKKAFCLTGGGWLGRSHSLPEDVVVLTVLCSGGWTVHAHMMGMQVADLDLSSRHQQGSLFRIDYGKQLEQLEQLEG